MPRPRLLIAALLLVPLTLAVQLVFWPAPSEARVVTDRFDAQLLSRGAAFGHLRYLWTACGLFCTTLMFGLLAAPGVSAALARVAAGICRGPVAAGVLVGTFCLVATRSLSLAISLQGQYEVERAFGLHNRSLAAWAGPHLLGQGLSVAVLLAALGLLLFASRRHGSRGWMAAAAILAAGAFTYYGLEPILAGRLSGSRHPLANTKDTAALFALSARIGFPGEALLVARTSGSSNRLGALVSGLGPAARIQLGDKVLRDCEPREAAVVLAHELGHWLKGDVLLGAVLKSAGLAAGVLLLAFLFPAPQPRDVPAMLLALWLMRLATMPAYNHVSRTLELRADRASLELTGDSVAYLRARERFARANLSDPDPPALAVWLLYTHPPVADRLRVALAK